MSESVYKGTDLKFNVSIQSEGFSQKDDDWFLVLMKGRNEIQRFNKEDIIDTGIENEFILCVETADLAAGDYDIVVHALVPDNDFPDGIRDEVYKERLMTVKKL